MRARAAGPPGGLARIIREAQRPPHPWLGWLATRLAGPRPARRAALLVHEVVVASCGALVLPPAAVQLRLVSAPLRRRLPRRPLSGGSAMPCCRPGRHSGDTVARRQFFVRCRRPLMLRRAPDGAWRTHAGYGDRELVTRVTISWEPTAFVLVSTHAYGAQRTLGLAFLDYHATFIATDNIITRFARF